jgi:hypothetical protein
MTIKFQDCNFRNGHVANPRNIDTLPFDFCEEPFLPKQNQPYSLRSRAISGRYRKNRLAIMSTGRALVHKPQKDKRKSYFELFRT